ncbi:glutamate racemase [Tunicatimonas pelagia]|uniref:glutamate racemase n=1 Tax=Tunicatimonas pelagia TaxID=931531 RepID=UPI0026655A5F|nr:glutamate racemase [Tunicatimonas pelagia]WKN40423.1 glutamate racemase [Tunicatimonas pelagia]
MNYPVGPIGVFDSGYGGLTIFQQLVKQLPQYDYIYLGDNARNPYGIRSYDVVYHYTLECVRHLFGMGCNLVILACNTASAKALRTIQQRDLPELNGSRRILGVIRPTTEIIGSYSQSGHVGLFATQGTVNSESYLIEIKKFFPEVKIYQEACPMWVPLVENNEHNTIGAEYFIRQHTDRLLSRSPDIDTILLACTHYPLLAHQIAKFLPAHVQLISQGEIVARSLASYLNKHPEMKARCTQRGIRKYFTTESTEDFDTKAQIFLEDHHVRAEHLQL